MEIYPDTTNTSSQIQTRERDPADPSANISKLQADLIHRGVNNSAVVSKSHSVEKQQ